MTFLEEMEIPGTPANAQGLELRFRGNPAIAGVSTRDSRVFLVLYARGAEAEQVRAQLRAITRQASSDPIANDRRIP